MQEFNRSQKLVISMVGLPARGKTYISRKLQRYLNWLGYNSKVFNIGNYRRQICGTECDQTFFDQKNDKAVKARNECAVMALRDMINFLKTEGEIGLFDGTNTTIDRRHLVQQTLLESFDDISILWVESICNDDDVIQNNIRLTKLNNPDYIGMSAVQATQDFIGRIRKYEEIYETITDEENLSYLKLINIGENIVIHNVQGYLQSKVISFLMNLHIYPRPIYFTRHGESQSNVLNQVGGDLDLTDQGEQYAHRLGSFLAKEFPDPGQRNQIQLLTSTMRRALHTTEIVTEQMGIKFISLKTLDELNVGYCDGMTYKEIANKFPLDFEERRINKLKYRYPRGESYLDLISRIEPVIFEIERSRQAVIVISHQAVLRCLYAYFHQKEIEQVPLLEIPLHCIIKLVPATYYCDEKRYQINPYTGEQTMIEESFENKSTRTMVKSKSYIDL